MFSNLGLFARFPCPEQSCHRQRCIFTHNAHSKLSIPKQSTGSIHEPPQKRTRLPKDGPMMRRVTLPTRSDLNSRSSEAAVRLKEETRIVKLSVMPMLSPQPAEYASTRSPLSPPSISLAKRTPQPISDRQKALHILFGQFSKLYTKVIQDEPMLAHESAIAQELDISQSTSNLKAYKSAIHHAAVSISRRDPPNRIPHPSIGTLKESRKAIEAEELKLANRLTVDRVKPYCASRETMLKWGYPDPADSNIQSPLPNPCVNAEGTTQTCDRCKIPFCVSSSHINERIGECLFHYGRMAPERVEGHRKWIYSCCRKERGSLGCEEGIHVFSEHDDDIKLAQREPYLTTQQVVAEHLGSTSLKTAYPIVALDCEMIYTTLGSSLARVTLVDEEGNCLLDEFVRQSEPVLDLNTRFSGIRSSDLQKAVMDLSAIRQSVCTFISPGTIVVGHGLENDFRALRLLHDQIIDTAILFPHERGHPFRRALRELVKEKLGYFIQDRTADAGHSSIEDAKAALDVLKWKVREDTTVTSGT